MKKIVSLLILMSLGVSINVPVKVGAENLPTQPNLRVSEKPNLQYHREYLLYCRYRRGGRLQLMGVYRNIGQARAAMNRLERRGYVCQIRMR